MGKMLSRRQMQHLCICLALGLLLCSLWQAAAWGRTQLHTGDAVCADTLRLHIRAASDAVADQSAKLRVRDAVLAVMQQCPAQSAPEARAWAAGAEVVRQNGSPLRDACRRQAPQPGRFAAVRRQPGSLRIAE